MPRRIGVFGATPETLRLLRELMANPLLELSSVWDADPAAALLRARQVAPEIVPHIEPLLTDDLGAFLRSGSLHAVIDSGEAPSFGSRFPQAADRGVQILTPLTARLLWADRRRRVWGVGWLVVPRESSRVLVRIVGPSF